MRGVVKMSGSKLNAELTKYQIGELQAGMATMKTSIDALDRNTTAQLERMNTQLAQIHIAVIANRDTKKRVDRIEKGLIGALVFALIGFIGWTASLIAPIFVRGR